jgi:hypothetical protein
MIRRLFVGPSTIAMNGEGSVTSSPHLHERSSCRKFTTDEHLKLRNLVDSFGTRRWQEIAELMGDRCARQCRERYNNYLAETPTSHPWTAEEDAIIVRKYHEIGPHWVEIAKLLSGNSVKNRWHKRLCKSGHLDQKLIINLAQAIGFSKWDWMQFGRLLSRPVMDRKWP